MKPVGEVVAVMDLDLDGNAEIPVKSWPDAYILLCKSGDTYQELFAIEIPFHDCPC